MEISQGQMIATCSLDGMIRIWRTPEFKIVTEFDDIDKKDNAKFKHINGVRGMDYTPELGGNIVCFGYSTYLNVWSPDSSLSKSFVGRLEGHQAIIVVCKMFPLSSNCITADERCNIKIWELRNLMPIASIRNEGPIGSLITAIAIFPETDSFVLGGKRIQIYRNLATSEQMDAGFDEKMPRYAFFNSYFRAFFVMTQ